MDKTIRLAVFDWAGTMTDFGSQAPMLVFDRTFSQFGLHFSREEINAPMGMEKKAHIRTMLSTENGRALWLEAKGRAWNEDDVECVYRQFEENLRQVVAEHSEVIPGAAETAAALRGRGIKIGSTTGYTSEMMQYVLPVAAAGGYAPDCVVTPDITGYSRPTPFMLFECMRRAGVYPPACVVKVGDTTTDIREGKNAGAWAVGVLVGSNLMGLSLQEYEQADEATLRTCKEKARAAYFAAGADLVIDSIWELPAAIDALNARLVEGGSAE